MGKYIKVKYDEKACSFCGQMYTPKKADSMYCSKRCSTNASRVKRGIEPCIVRTKICKCCGQEFETDYKRRKYCYSCRPYKSDHHAHKPIKQFKCVICGKEYESSDYRRKTCGSKECLRKNQDKHRTRPKKIKKIKTPVEYEIRVCVICGKEFEVDKRRHNKTCSHECSMEYTKEKRRVYQRNREKRIANVLVDRDISLDTLRRRDNNKCWICGKETDPTDYKIINGTIVVGESYPSIDHLIPIARGGLHQWENVRLAHKGCNSQRGATLCEKVDELTREEARRFARKICKNKKEVVQFIDGVEYARYESTAEAARLNNFKDKSIQNACRGKGTWNNHRMYGFEWKYAEG